MRSSSYWQAAAYCSYLVRKSFTQTAKLKMEFVQKVCHQQCQNTFSWKQNRRKTRVLSGYVCMLQKYICKAYLMQWADYYYNARGCLLSQVPRKQWLQCYIWAALISRRQISLLAPYIPAFRWAKVWCIFTVSFGYCNNRTICFRQSQEKEERAGENFWVIRMQFSRWNIIKRPKTSSLLLSTSQWLRLNTFACSYST